MEFAFVDLQGFNSNENFVVKEICILTKNLKFHEIVKSPHSFSDLTSKYKQQVKWLENNYHGLRWSQGYITQEELLKTIVPILRNKFIFVKGSNKLRWLREMLDQQIKFCVNIEDMDCNIKLSYPISKDCIDQENEKVKCCNKHTFMKSHCALRNALLIRQWHTINIRKKIKD